MELTTPSYYHRFRCLAGNCPDSCCKEWDVQVDPDAAGYYRSLPGELGERLRQVLLDTEDGILMRNENGRCPMWRQDGLCRIQAKLGEQALCRVCREYPRLTHDYGDFQERQLELSCPEAARLILNDTDGALLTEEIPGGEAGDYDPEAMEVLRRTRNPALSLLMDSYRPVNEALALLLMYGYQAQAELDGEEPAVFDPEPALETARQVAKAGRGEGFLEFFTELEILTEEWKRLLEQPAGMDGWPEQLRALARYGALRYWLQAVSDYDLVSRVKLVIISCLTVRALGGDLCSTAQLYSKEIENDTDNVEAILDGAYTHPGFTDAELLHRLLKP